MLQNHNDDNRLPQWLLWLVGAATVMAAALMILATVLGVRAGQQQLEIQKRQNVGIYLQQAIDYRADGDLEAALAQYQRVLVLDPTNVAAVEGIERLFQLAANTTAQVTAPPAAQPVTAQPVQAAAVSPLAAPAPTLDPVAAAWQSAQDRYAAGDWEAAVTQVLAVQQLDPAFATAQVTDLLYNSYVNLAAERDQAGKLEEALSYVDQALALRPDGTLRQARSMAATYLDMLTYYGADWARVIALLSDLYDRDPTYRDVEARLVEAYISYGDKLMAGEDYCAAMEQYVAAIDINVQPDLFEKRNTAKAECGEDAPVADGALTTLTAAGRATPTSRVAVAPTTTARTTAPAPAETPTTAPVAAPADAVGAPQGQILYSALNVDDSRMRIFAQTAGGSGSPSIVVEDGTQPAMRGDGKRLVYYNTRSDRIGLSSFDPDTGLQLRFTQFSEDRGPSWSPNGNRIVFASNREGDRRWRVYVAWAEENGAVTTLGFGETAAWHPLEDVIVFKGCDESGNGCGLWTMTGSGGNRRPLTSIPADGNPAWSPDGAYVVFTSSGRHGNYEVYRVAVADGSVARLTDDPAIDGIPTVSPDSKWVAFLSNRGGAWKLWAVPLAGGDARAVASIQGEVGNWLEQQLQWIN